MTGTSGYFGGVIFFMGTLFLIVFCRSFDVQAQVIIKERLEIKSKTNAEQIQSLPPPVHRLNCRYMTWAMGYWRYKAEN